MEGCVCNLALKLNENWKCSKTARHEKSHIFSPAQLPTSTRLYPITTGKQLNAREIQRAESQGVFVYQRRIMEGSGAILCQISLLKDMLDQVITWLIFAIVWNRLWSFCRSIGINFFLILFIFFNKFVKLIIECPGEWRNRSEFSDNQRNRIRNRQVFWNWDCYGR